MAPLPAAEPNWSFSKRQAAFDIMAPSLTGTPGLRYGFLFLFFIAEFPGGKDRDVIISSQWTVAHCSGQPGPRPSDGDV